MAARERIIQAAASVPRVGAGGLLPTPFQFTLTGTESLRVSAHCRNQTSDVDIGWRHWRADTGDVQLSTQTFHNTAKGATSSKDYALSAGALMNVRAGTTDATIKYGQLWVKLQILAGSGGNPQVIGTLAQGFVSRDNDLAWPGSPIANILDFPGVITDGNWQANVAGGLTRIDAIVPSAVRWRVMCGLFQVTTSAVVGNRVVLAEAVDDAGTTLYAATSAPDQAPSTTVTYNLEPGTSATGLIVEQTAHVPWPQDLDLPANYLIRMLLWGAVAGDAMTALGLRVRQWIDP